MPLNKQANAKVYMLFGIHAHTHAQTHIHILISFTYMCINKECMALLILRELNILCNALE